MRFPLISLFVVSAGAVLSCSSGPKVQIQSPSAASPVVDRPVKPQSVPRMDDNGLHAFRAMNLKIMCQKEGVCPLETARADSLVVRAAAQRGESDNGSAELKLELAGTLYDLALTKHRLERAERDISELRRLLHDFKGTIDELETMRPARPQPGPVSGDRK